MDIIKLMLFISLVILSSRTESAIFDMSEHSGYIRGSDGTFSHVSANGTIRSVSSAQVMGTVERINIPTERGTFPVEIQRSANVDMSRLGKAVSKFAQKVGPLSMVIAAADLICDLAQICNTDGQWKVNQVPDINTQLRDSIGWIVNATSYPSSTLAQAIATQFNGAGYGVISGDCNCMATDFNWSPSQNGGSLTFKLKGSSGNYLSGVIEAIKQSALVPPTNYQPATANDWTSKENLLNDDRFVPHLNNADEDIPVQFPSIQVPVNKQVSNTTATNRDSNGNVTGTTQTKTEVELSDGPDQTKPNEITVIEKTTVTNYDVNNNVINSTTNVVNQEKPAPQEVKIEFDNTTDTPLENYSVPASFAYDSWGSGNCPADRQVSYHYGTLNLTFEPACDFAIAMQPAILAVAGFLAMFIIAGVRNND